jgi:hypothetical protein
MGNPRDKLFWPLVETIVARYLVAARPKPSPSSVMKLGKLKDENEKRNSLTHSSKHGQATAQNVDISKKHNS